MAQLHQKLGGTVQARYTTHVTTLHVVGVATMPAIGIGHGLHLSLGDGRSDRLHADSGQCP